MTEVLSGADAGGREAIRHDTSNSSGDLDPSSEADTLAALVSTALRLGQDHLRSLREQRVYRRPPEEVRRRIEAAELGEDGVPIAAIETLFEEVVEHRLGMGHPHWWAYIASSAHPAGVAAELVAATINNACFPTAQLAVDMERTAVRWMTELCGAPQLVGGLLTSGGSAANFTCLAAARESALAGLDGSRPIDRLRVYGSGQTHNSIVKAVRLLGLPLDAFRACATDGEQRARPEDLRRQLAADTAAGWIPMAIVANAGTVTSGRIDPIDPLADLAEEYGAWLHVDGAYGGFGHGLPEITDLYRGIERADSLSADAHKWLYVPYEAAAAAVAEPRWLEAAFSVHASYLSHRAEDYIGGPLGFDHQGLQLTRSFRALKIWAVLLSLGKSRLRELWRKDIAVAARVRSLVDRHPRLENLAGSDLSCFCIRYLPRHRPVDEFNQDLLDRVHRDGRFFVGPDRVDDQFALRGCVVNYRSEIEDADRFVDRLLHLGERLESGG